MNLRISNSLLSVALLGGAAYGQSASDTQHPAAIPPVPAFQTEDAQAYGQALAAYADAYDSGWIDEYASSTMSLYDARGDVVVRKTVRMLLEGEQGDKTIIRFLSPAEIKGVAALTHEHPQAVDDNWLYLPANKRVRRISGANKTASFQGTEFTYEDLSNLVVSKYGWRFLGESDLQVQDQTQPVFKLEAVSNYQETGYSRLVVYINRNHWRRERIDFYDKAGRLLKTLTQDQWQHYHRRFWRAQRLVMDNQQTKKRTVIENTTDLLDLSRYTSKKTGKPRENLTAEHFTTRPLER
jgi:hypothetical protein